MLNKKFLIISNWIINLVLIIFLCYLTLSVREKYNEQVDLNILLKNQIEDISKINQIQNQINAHSLKTDFDNLILCLLISIYSGISLTHFINKKLSKKNEILEENE